ncbi:Smr/MutS family protein [Breoghania sp. L-A4]|uniref:Smr/MutS family protein n=1 Tax=Breoghania sp. L-A4 TaxID=2304600 RepID=UPI0020C09D7A|nr:Smr/MutS family protein [Breoghania sp. L-A4]
MSENERKRRKRALSAEEHTLWKRVTETLKPLPGDTRVRAVGKQALAKDKPAAVAAKTPEKPKATTALAGRLVAPPLKKTAPAAPSPGALDRRMLQRLVRGRTAIDGRIDLHGLTQSEAHGRLHSYLAGAQARGHKVVLVITGKGGDGYDGRGVLRRMVPHWLQLPQFRDLVNGFEEAHASHGGSGALYVRIRRRKPPHGFHGF